MVAAVLYAIACRRRPRDRRLFPVPGRVRQGRDQQAAARHRRGHHRRNGKDGTRRPLVLCPPEPQCAGRAAIRSGLGFHLAVGAGPAAHGRLVRLEPGCVQRQPAGAAGQPAQFRRRAHARHRDGRGRQCVDAFVRYRNRRAGAPVHGLGPFSPLVRAAAGGAGNSHAQETPAQGSAVAGRGGGGKPRARFRRPGRAVDRYPEQFLPGRPGTDHPHPARRQDFSHPGRLPDAAGPGRAHRPVQPGRTPGAGRDAEPRQHEPRPLAGRLELCAESDAAVRHPRRAHGAGGARHLFRQRSTGHRQDHPAARTVRRQYRAPRQRAGLPGPRRRRLYRQGGGRLRRRARPDHDRPPAARTDGF